jgi:hypothetical protein
VQALLGLAHSSECALRIAARNVPWLSGLTGSASTHCLKVSRTTEMRSSHGITYTRAQFVPAALHSRECRHVEEVTVEVATPYSIELVNEQVVLRLSKLVKRRALKGFLQKLGDPLAPSPPAKQATTVPGSSSLNRVGPFSNCPEIWPWLPPASRRAHTS